MLKYNNKTHRRQQTWLAVSATTIYISETKSNSFVLDIELVLTVPVTETETEMMIFSCKFFPIFRRENCEKCDLINI